MTQQKFTLLILLCMASFLNSCITTVTAPLDISFEEKLVVRGVVRSGEALENISITKSLPVLEEPTNAGLQVSGVEGTIAVNGQIYPLVQQSPMLYGIQQPSIRAASGMLLTLNLTRKLPNGTVQSASAETRIPSQPVIRGVRIIPQTVLSVTTATPIPGAQPVTIVSMDTVFAAEVVLEAEPRVAYRIGLQAIDTSQNQALTQVYESSVLFHTESAAQERTINSSALPRNTQVLLRNPAFRYKIIVYAFDEAYYPYFLTRGRGQQATNIFGGANENVSWNVKGDAIGMFIGVTERTVFVRP
ncbi:MAG: DUF4249 family protein [Candidatus Kapaibacterium sp.]|nr:MAG: DUF4249 family protein [Candidatus Kapabacteria bacterium]